MMIKKIGTIRTTGRIRTSRTSETIETIKKINTISIYIHGTWIVN